MEVLSDYKSFKCLAKDKASDCLRILWMWARKLIKAKGRKELKYY
jgi:hypothetical protein